MEEIRKLAIPDGYEFDRVEGGEVILKKKEVEMPQSYGACIGRLYGEYNAVTAIVQKDDEKAFVALFKLLICRNAWWKQLGWKPDWTDEKEPFKWCIHTNKGMVEITSHSKFSRVLAFPTREIAAEFLDTFRDLIKKAKELL